MHYSHIFRFNIFVVGVFNKHHFLGFAIFIYTLINAFQVFFQVSFAIWNIFRKISVYDRILDKFVIFVSGMFINFPSRSRTCQFCRPSVLDYSYSYFHIKVVQLSKDLTYFIHCVFLLEHACLS